MIFESLPNSKEFEHALNGTTDDNLDRPLEANIPMIEKFLKDEIIMLKTCGCPKCNIQRSVYRTIQYIIADYRKLKGIQDPPNLGPKPTHPRVKPRPRKNGR